MSDCLCTATGSDVCILRNGSVYHLAAQDAGMPYPRYQHAHAGSAGSVEAEYANFATSSYENLMMGLLFKHA